MIRSLKMFLEVLKKIVWPFKKPTDPCADYIERLNRQAKERDLKAGRPKPADHLGIHGNTFDTLNEIAKLMSTDVSTLDAKLRARP